MRLGGSTVLVVVLAAGCGTGAEGGGNPKKLAELEKRVAALEREVRSGAAGEADKVERSTKAERAPRGEPARADRRKAEAGGDRGRIDVAGDALRVALVRDGSRIDLPGPVPAGTWEIVARFDEGEANRVKAGTVTVAKGQTLTLECTAASRSCTAR